MEAIFDDLRRMRRPLLVLATLLFVIVLLEVDLGHRPALAQRELSLALLPVVWLPLSLLALMAVQMKPSRAIAAACQAAMAIAAVIGLAGAVAHAVVSGVTLDQPDRVFSLAVWGGPACPNWPIAITLAAVLGFIGAFGAGDGVPLLPNDPTGMICSVAFALIVAGIGLSATPATLAESAAGLVFAALLLLVALLALLTAAALERRPT
ncbi:MAG: hypothetical protein KGL11_06150 [Alphaproteobacteria bacterium]|nr:hypothetical protein [Alphaproteobacteria bacterium]